MSKKFYQRLTLRGKESAAGETRPFQKYYLIAVISVIILANLTGLYPEFAAGPIVTSIFYILFFIYVFFTENRTRKSDKSFQLKTAYLVFSVLLSAACVTGGFESALRWAVYILAFVLLYRKYHFHSLTLVLISGISFLVGGNNITKDFWFLNSAFIILITIFFFTHRENVGIRKKVLPDNLDSGKETGDFKVTAYALLKNITKLYKETSRATTVLVYLKNHSDEKKYDMILNMSDDEMYIDQDHVIDITEGILGAAVSKKELFKIEAKGMKLPYYRKTLERNVVVTVPVILNKMIGVVVVDSKYETFGSDEKSRVVLTDFSNEVSRILELFEINQKVSSNERRISKLYEIYEKLNLLEGKEKLMETFFREIESFDICSGYIAEMQSDNKTLEIVSSSNYKREIVGERFETREDEILRYIFDSGKSSVIDGVKGKNIHMNFSEGKVDKFLISILKGREDIYGIVKLDKKTFDTFTKFEIRTIEMILSRITMLLENAKLYEKIRKQALEDGLTGLTNHLTFQERLRESIERCDKGEIKCVSLFLMDIDFFKKFNDTFGHQEGDRVLIKVADMLRKFEKENKNTFAARYGGEEFVFVLDDYTAAEAAHIAEQIREYSEENLTGGNDKETRSIHLSIGVSSYPNAKDARAMIKTADEWLYIAKEEGRNRVKYR